ncbi:hypothetical protein HK097_011500 [Rhizophlyctis rosea]|uniref:Uncharacterized protein n=1 Tax=Rhizophlyctis rosea TaxID=64517 RepID=A0AAD5SE96_9FUNG|nr:hypothetical protein HK097_011500 [Rhizophlyctis rosea]
MWRLGGPRAVFAVIVKGDQGKNSIVFPLYKVKISTYAGYTAVHLGSYADVLHYDPMNIIFNEIFFKGLTAVEAVAVDRACEIINFATRPGCDSTFWKTVLIQDPNNNQLTVNHSYVDDYEMQCRTELAAAQVPPFSLKNYAVSMTIATQSTVVKAMIAVNAFGLIVQAIFMVLLLVKTNTRVIKAAAVGPSEPKAPSPETSVD